MTIEPLDPAVLLAVVDALVYYFRPILGPNFTICGARLQVLTYLVDVEHMRIHAATATGLAWFNVPGMDIRPDCTCDVCAYARMRAN